ncbi:hypothetical protein OG552_13000 [Streptomyces sp. NBC_01476]|uniref:hypothetical protein n=1 Tax=Streptomyces sp. NBC_01476 TaxID=2903881 RepID=UPI002E37E515|nr:hypothetical protein [Streptomyces sp. NBC_01476]
MALKDKAAVWKALSDGELFRVELVNEVRGQVGKSGGYAVPFRGEGKGFVPRDVATLLTAFSSDPFELFQTIKAMLELDESGQVGPALSDYLSE